MPRRPAARAAQGVRVAATPAAAGLRGGAWPG